MPVQDFTGRNLPALMLTDIPTKLFVLGQEWEGESNRYIAVREKAPQFVLEGDDPVELYHAAEARITRFLAKMHRFGFRS